MKITKQKLDDIKRCYCASNIELNGENHLLLASEDPNVLCAMYSGENFEKKEVIWNEAGGCMSIIPIPGKEGEFLAVQEFYLKVSPSNAKIVWGKYSKEGWIVKDVLQMPYIHRFDIYNKNGVNYFIGATIAESKTDKEDWSKPGKIYVGALPEDLNEGIHVEVLVEGLYKNHGYCRDVNNVEVSGYFGSDQGITKVTPPESLEDKWLVETIMTGEIGEIALVDIDNDGEKEIMTIEPFHGNQIKIYHKNGDNYKEIWKYDNEIEFAHTLAGATLDDKNVFVAGIRRKDAELMYVDFQNGKIQSHIIEKGVGPANVCVVNEKNRDLIVSANHTANEAAVYIVSK